jgi:hypothetical protein
VTVRFRRRREQLREIGEAEAYERSYGERHDVKLVQLPPRRPRDRDVLATGDLLRRAFLDRLQSRHPDPESDRSDPEEKH